MTTVDGLLREAGRAGVDRLDARLLVAFALGQPPPWPIAHGDAPVDAAAAARVRGLLARRARGEPLAYLVGEREFHGLSIAVDARVLVPRPETEGLVDWALQLLASEAGRAGPGPPGVGRRVLDLGTGSGAIALALKHRMPGLEVVATDASAAALECAAANARRLGLDIEFRQGSWWQAAGDALFDLVVSNPPYVAEGDPHLPALAAEPRAALVGGPDGLDAIRRIAAGAAAHLREGGWLLLEHGWDQAEPVAALVRDAGLRSVETRHDLAGHARCTGARR